MISEKTTIENYRMGAELSSAAEQEQADAQLNAVGMSALARVEPAHSSPGLVASITGVVKRQADDWLGQRAVTLYRVEVVQGGQTWFVLRRYSKFHNMHNELHQAHSLRGKLPTLPPKRIRPSVEERRLLLDEYLQCLLATPSLASDPIVQRFLAPPASGSLDVLPDTEVTGTAEGSAAVQLGHIEHLVSRAELAGSQHKLSIARLVDEANAEVVSLANQGILGNGTPFNAAAWLAASAVPSLVADALLQPIYSAALPMQPPPELLLAFLRVLLRSGGGSDASALVFGLLHDAPLLEDLSDAIAESLKSLWDPTQLAVAAVPSQPGAAHVVREAGVTGSAEAEARAEAAEARMVALHTKVQFLEAQLAELEAKRDADAAVTAANEARVASAEARASGAEEEAARERKLAEEMRAATSAAAQKAQDATALAKARLGEVVAAAARRDKAQEELLLQSGTLAAAQQRAHASAQVGHVTCSLHRTALHRTAAREIRPHARLTPVWHRSNHSRPQSIVV